MIQETATTKTYGSTPRRRRSRLLWNERQIGIITAEATLPHHLNFSFGPSAQAADATTLVDTLQWRV